MACIHLVIGPVGAGKSTFAQALATEQNAVRLTLDEWMSTLYGEDPRPQEGRMKWYLDRTERCLEQIWRTTEALLCTGTDVVLEVGLIQRSARQRFYCGVDANAYALKVYVVDAPREVRRARVERRNMDKGRTFSMVVPPEVFELASDLWEPPADDERQDRVVTDATSEVSSAG